jgi:4-hydroxy-tetrahydrodipicolinate synthase
MNIAADTILRLSEIPNIAGVKEASGNFAQIMRILAQRPDGFLLLSGDDAVTLPIIALGGDGVVSVVANEVPALTSRMVRAALEGRWHEARELHYRLLPLMEANFIESNPIPVKAALWLMGKVELSYRLPLVPPAQATLQTLRKLLGELGVEVVN